MSHFMLYPLFLDNNSLQSRVDDGRWHKDRLNRKRRIGVMQVDSTKPLKVRSPKGGSVLNTDGMIWIGA